MNGVTPREAAEQIGVSVQTIHRMIKLGTIDAIPVRKTRRGTTHRIPQSEVDRIKPMYQLTPEELKHAQPDTATE